MSFLRKISIAYVFVLIFVLSACDVGLSNKNAPTSSKSVSEITTSETKTEAITEPSTIRTTAKPTTSKPIKTTAKRVLSPKTTKSESHKSLSKMLDSMTIEEKVGQMFIARCPSSNAAYDAKKYQPGGYILFGRDFKDKSKHKVITNIKDYQSASKIKLLIGVDEEGGTVNRVSLYKQFRAVPFMSPQALYRLGGLDLIKSDAKEKCTLLHSMGINVNLAPVSDISTDKNDFIYSRSFGKPAEETSEYITAVTKIMKSNNMGVTLKHFPGYGNNKDTHTGIAYDDRSYETFLKSDFLPFKAGINAGADMVLVSHNIVKCMDEKYPASLSQRVHQILRTELDFNGVIMTDDLAMDAIRDYTDNGSAAVMAVKAGNDMLCCTDFKEQIPAVISAVKSGDITEKRLDESVMRILKMKRSLSII